MNHAAFKQADLDDARRGHPVSDLSAYARGRGLEPIGQKLVGHVAGLNPRWQDYAFNVMRGEVVPGRFGTVQHELYEVALGDDAEPVVPCPRRRCCRGSRRSAARSPCCGSGSSCPASSS